MGGNAVQQFKKLLREDKAKKMPRCKLIILGERRVGKTSLLRLLLGKKFVKDQVSTRGIDAAMVTTLDISSEKWVEVDPESIGSRSTEQFVCSKVEDLAYPLKIFFTRTKPKQKPEPSKLEADLSGIIKYLNDLAATEHCEQAANDIPPEPSDTQLFDLEQSSPLMNQFVKHSAPSAKKQPAIQQETHVVQSLSHLPPLVPQKAEAPPKGAKPGRNMLRDIVDNAREGSSIKEPALQYKTLDFAGQPEYRAMHHCFIVRRAIYLVVFNLQIVREAIKSPNDINKQALEEIRYWLNSIHAHIYKLGPEPLLKRILLVGTHRGSMDRADMKIIDNKLRKKIEGTQLFNDIYKADAESEFLFASVENSIDGKDENDRRDSGASSLQETIHNAWNELPFKKEKYPSIWLLFEAYLNQLCGTTNPIVSVASIKDAAKEKYGIGEDSDEYAELALRFFHDTGIYHFFNPNKIICMYYTYVTNS